MFAGGSHRLEGEEGWTRGLPDLPGYLADIEGQLAGAERGAAATAEQRGRWDADDARRAAATPDPALAEQERAEAAASLERYRAEHPRRVEALLERIARAVEK
jgi:hypothetical protein